MSLAEFSLPLLRATIAKLTEERDEALARCETLRELADSAAWEQGNAQRRMMEAQKTVLIAAKESDAALVRARSAERECDILTAERDDSRLQANKQAGLYAEATRERDKARAALRALVSDMETMTGYLWAHNMSLPISAETRTAVKAALEEG